MTPSPIARALPVAALASAAGCAVLVGCAVLAGCAVVDAPFLALRSVAGGLHNARRMSGIRPFFLPDGRLGAAANGALHVEDAPGGALAALTDVSAEIDDPDASGDGRALVFASGRDLVSAGGAHQDHVFQLYALDLDAAGLDAPDVAAPRLGAHEWRRLSRSRRAESLPRWTGDGAHVVFARRAEYAGWSRDDPWGPASLFVAEADGSRERRLGPPLSHPLSGLALLADDSLAVFGAADAEGRRVLYALDLGSPGEPRVLLEDAYLPARVPGADEVVVARARPGRHALARVDAQGRVLQEIELPEHALLGDVLGLAVAPGAARIAWSDFDPRPGTRGEYRLWALARGADEPELVLRVPYRAAERFKPLDVVEPPSWWFRPSASPGSR